MEQLILSVRIERRRPLIGVLAACLVWLVAAGFAEWMRLPPAAALADYAAFGAALLPPLALGLFVASLLPGAGAALALAEVEDRLAAATVAVTGLQAQLVDVDAALARSAEQTRQLAATAATSLPGLTDNAAALAEAAGRVSASGAEARSVADGLMQTLPAMAASISLVDATLRALGIDSGVQLRAVETTLAAVQSRNREAAAQADAAIAGMTGLLTRIDEASARNTAAISKRAYALDAAVDGVFGRTTAVMDHIHQQVEAHVQSFHAGVEASGRKLTILADDSVRLFNQRLEVLVRASGQITEQFSAHERGSERLRAMIEAQLLALESRFDGLGTAGMVMSERVRDGAAAHFGQIESRLAEVRATSADAAEDIGSRVAAIDAGIAALRRAVSENDAILNASLAANRAAMAEMQAETRGLLETLVALQAAVDAGVRRIAVPRDDTDADSEYPGTTTAMGDTALPASAAPSERIGSVLGENLANLARLLSVEIADADWARHEAGNFSAVARTIAARIEAETPRRIARLFQDDPAFRGEAERYLEMFETRTARLLAGGDGEALAAVLVESDIGKIYAAIAAAVNRPSPRHQGQ